MVWFCWGWIWLGAGGGGRGGKPHQVVVGRVGVIFWKGDVDPQGYTVGKDGQQDEDVKGPQVDSQGPRQIGLRFPTFPWSPPHPMLMLNSRHPALTSQPLS